MLIFLNFLQLNLEVVYFIASGFLCFAQKDFSHSGWFEEKELLILLLNTHPIMVSRFETYLSSGFIWDKY